MPSRYVLTVMSANLDGRRSRRKSCSRRSAGPTRKRLMAAAALSIALVASACGGTDAATDEATGAGSGELAAGSALDASVLSGTATTYTGETFDLATLAGEDLIVWFWAPW